MLQSTGSQTVRHDDLATEQQQKSLFITNIALRIFKTRFGEAGVQAKQRILKLLLKGFPLVASPWGRE